MSDKKDHYDRTYGMSFHNFLLLCTPCTAAWYVEGLKHLDDPWMTHTKAEEIVGKKAVAELVERMHLS